MVIKKKYINWVRERNTWVLSQQRVHSNSDVTVKMRTSELHLLFDELKYRHITGSSLNLCVIVDLSRSFHWSDQWFCVWPYWPARVDQPSASRLSCNVWIKLSTSSLWILHRCCNMTSWMSLGCIISSHQTSPNNCWKNRNECSWNWQLLWKCLHEIIFLHRKGDTKYQLSWTPEL